MTTIGAQFFRIEAFPFPRVDAVLAEASRKPDYCRHVEEPDEPMWVVGSAGRVAAAVQHFMQTPATYLRPNGRRASRKRRRDARCLIGGVCSWPTAMAEIRQLARSDKEAADRELQRMREWVRKTRDWLSRKWGNDLAAVLFHTDESHPHLHFLLVGDATRLHPGLAAEWRDGKRMESRKEKVAAYKGAMAHLLDEYHAAVGAACGLSRCSESQPRPRIRDRALAARMLDVERRLQERPDTDLSKALQRINADAPQYVRRRMIF